MNWLAGGVFEKAFEGLLIDRMEGNEEIFGKLMSDKDFRDIAIEHLLDKVYSRLIDTIRESSAMKGAK